VTRTAKDSDIRVRASYSYLGFGPSPGQGALTTVGGNVVIGGNYAYAGFTFVSSPTTRVMIDPNVRVRGNGTYAGFEDVDGPLTVGELVEVYEAESGITGEGRITEIDADRELVYLSVDWASLGDDGSRQGPSVQGAMLYFTEEQSTSEEEWMSLVARPCLAYVGFSDTTIWVTAPAGSWSTGAVSPRYYSPFLEVSSRLEILQPYAALRDDRVVAA
jgi:hypothetical protein